MSVKIYCIECKITGEKYVGSTIKKLYSRISNHRQRKSCVSRYIIERGDYKYYLLEEVEESQRLIREQYYMDNTENCINHNKAYGFNKKEFMKEYNKQYHELNKELNKDKKKEYDKQRYEYKKSWDNLLLIDPSLFG